MFDLVHDVEKYSEFLPWCAAAEILSEFEDSVEARIDIAFKNLEQSFSTRNSIRRYDRIDMQLVDGPFKHLRGTWSFTGLSEKQSKVEFFMDFEFKSVLLGKLAGSTFEKIAGNMVDAFAKRAADIYG